jgi:hypothetical protein
MKVKHKLLELEKLKLTNGIYFHKYMVEIDEDFWQIYNILFIRPNMSPLSKEIRSIINKRRKFGTFSSFYFSTVTFFLKKALFLSEIIKIGLYSNNKCERSKDHSSKKSVLLLSYSNHVSNQGRIFRLDRLIHELKKSKTIKPLFRRVIFASFTFII